MRAAHAGRRVPDAHPVSPAGGGVFLLAAADLKSIQAAVDDFPQVFVRIIFVIEPVWSQTLRDRGSEHASNSVFVLVSVQDSLSTEPHRAAI